MTTAAADPSSVAACASSCAPRTHLPKPASAAQVQSFVDDGFLVMPGLVSPEQIEELKADTARIARGHYPCPTLEPLPQDMPDAQVLKNILCIHQPHYISPVMKRYALHPEICGVLGQITAAHLPHWDGSVKCMQTMLFVKPPGFQGQAWHQDEIYIPTRDRSLIGAWIAIDDATLDNGCLWVVPGSQRSGYLYPQRKHELQDEWDFAPESHGFDETAKTPVVVKAGTVVFFNGYLLHCSYKNRSQTYRRVLVSHYMNAWSLLPWGTTASGKSVASEDARKIMLAAGSDPYAWKGAETDHNVWLRTCKANAPAEKPPEKAPEKAG